MRLPIELAKVFGNGILLALTGHEQSASCFKILQVTPAPIKFPLREPLLKDRTTEASS